MSHARARKLTLGALVLAASIAAPGRDPAAQGSARAFSVEPPPARSAARAMPATPAAKEESRPLRIDARARALAPGEPVRIMVRADQPLEELSGSFDGKPVFFTHVDARGSLWSGWAVIPLDRKAGKARIEVSGRLEPVTAAEHATPRPSASPHPSDRGGEEAGDSRAPAAGADDLHEGAIQDDDVRRRELDSGAVLDRPGRRVVTASVDIAIERRVFPEQRLDVEEKFVTPPPEVEQRIARETERLSAVYAARRAVAPPGRAFVRPVSGQPTGVFGTRRIFNGKPRSPHPGLDLKAASGTLVRCSGPGVVALADDLYFSGNTVIVDHGGGLFTIYAHLSRIDVEARREIAEGDPVGLSGATGRVTGPHLHWGAKIGDRPFDPTALLSAKLFPSGPS